ncbi:hypothetical protein GCK72_018473 [Caenorhabditis remanei]|uniref:DUF7809 domain-containing protein n=1 Tax=Caenorhabditis remanei TaxID=31234 RepID=A0A6A5GBZ1_CAERE|nr:hypothetical protein GCK72_018473 [Caenorhabditis remanei]KAF1751919.1 hypothetical protein GCK72_018473 [Caenorhabditis remanei]
MIDFPNVFRSEYPPVSDNFLMVIAKSYILSNFWSDHYIEVQQALMHSNDERVVKRLQELFNKSNHRLRMYGSAEELAHNLKIYRNFQNSQSRFTTNALECWNTKPILYSGTDGKHYVSKHDMFVLIQNLPLKTSDSESLNLVGYIFFLGLKTHWKEIQNCNEFVKCDESLLENLGKDFLDFFNELRDNESPGYCLKVDAGTVEEVVYQWKNLFENNTYENEYTGLLVDRIYQEVPTKYQQEVWKTSFRLAKALLESLNRVITARPSWFLPSEEKLNRKLRLFEDYGHKFLLVLEVFKVGGIKMLEKFGSSRYISYYDGRPEVNGFFTIDFKTFKSKLGKEIESLTFIKTPVLRAKHAAVPISFTNVEHCTLASDVLFELLRELILGYKLFQRTENEKKEGIMLNRIFTEILDEYFHVPEVHFFNQSTVETIKNKFQSYISRVKRSVQKDVRNAKKDGFTVQNLKNELVHLGLHFEFPDIGGYAEMVYKRIDSLKTREFLRTCDLFDAVEQCQLICIMKKYEKLAVYIHKHKSCHRVWTPCKYCQTHKNTKWNRFMLKDVRLLARKVKNPAHRSSLDQQMVLPNGVNLVSNYDLVSTCNDEIDEQIENGTDFYLLDVKDVKSLATCNNSYDKYLRESMESRPQRKIYLRTFSATVFKEEENSRVFVDEVFDIVRVILQQQEIDIESYTDKFSKYCEQWEDSNILKSDKQKMFFETMSLDDLKEVLEDFNIDKRLITIVPDIGYAVSVMFKMPLDMGESVLAIRSPKMFHLVQDPNQTILQLFQSVICYLDMSIECPQHGRECKISLMCEIAIFMEANNLHETGVYYRSDFVTDQIKNLQNHCFFKLQTTQKRIMDKYYSTHFKQPISLYEYILDFQALKFDSHDYEKSDHADQILNNSYITAWRARFLILLEISGRFFHRDDEKIKEHKHRMWEALNFKLPFLDWVDQKDLSYVLWSVDKSKLSWAETLWFAEPCEIDKLDSHEWLIHNKNEREKLIRQRKKESMGRAYYDMENRSIRLMHNIRSTAVTKRIARQEAARQGMKEHYNENNVPKVEKTEEVVESKTELKSLKKEVPAKRIIESTDRASSPIDFNCQPCIENKEKLQKINEKLNLERNNIKILDERVISNEDQILQIKEKSEKEKQEQERKKIELSGKENLIKNFEKQLNTQQKEFQELEKLKKELERRHENLNRLKNQIEIQENKSKESASEFQQRETKLKRELNSKRQATKNLNREIEKFVEGNNAFGATELEEVLHRQQQVKIEIARKKHENQQLRERNRDLENSNHEKEIIYHSLLEQLEFSSKLNLNDQPSTSSSVPQQSVPHPVHLSTMMRNMLKLLEEKKATLVKEDSLKKTENFVHILMLSTDDEEKRNHIANKLKDFQADFTAYMNVLNQNIASIQNGNEDSMAELPELPNLDTYLNNPDRTFGRNSLSD